MTSTTTQLWNTLSRFSCGLLSRETESAPHDPATPNQSFPASSAGRKIVLTEAESEVHLRLSRYQDSASKTTRDLYRHAVDLNKLASGRSQNFGVRKKNEAACTEMCNRVYGKVEEGLRPELRELITSLQTEIPDITVFERHADWKEGNPQSRQLSQYPDA